MRKIETATEMAGRAARPAARRKGLAVAVARLRLCLARWRERVDLSELGEHQLRDIGLTHGQAAREAARPPWYGLDRR